MYRYSLLAESAVDKEKILVADQACKVFCLELGIPEPPLRFIRLDPNGPIPWADPIVGFAKRKPVMIYIAADQTLNEIVATIAHECEHCRQIAKGDELLAEERAREREQELWTRRGAGKSFREITLTLAEIGAREALSQRNDDALEWDLRLLRIGRKEIATQIEETRRIIDGIRAESIRARKREEIDDQSRRTGPSGKRF